MKKGKTLAGKEYKVHLGGCKQTDMLTKGDKSAREEVWYFTESTLAAARVGDFKSVFVEQLDGWFDPKVHLDWPGIYNLRLDPFAKMTRGDFLFAKDWWAFEFWRFVFVQDEAGMNRGTRFTSIQSLVFTRFRYAIPSTYPF